MAYVTIPKDLKNIKTKFIGNFTKRQCVCFGIGALAAVPAFFIVKNLVNSNTAFYVMIIVLIPFFLAGMIEKNGMPIEKYLKFFLHHKVFSPPIRRNRVENIYMAYARAEQNQREKGVNNGTGNSRKNTSSKTKK